MLERPRISLRSSKVTGGEDDAVAKVTILRAALGDKKVSTAEYLFVFEERHRGSTTKWTKRVTFALRREF